MIKWMTTKKPAGLTLYGLHRSRPAMLIVKIYAAHA
jgi:hypothetical protein